MVLARKSLIWILVLMVSVFAATAALEETLIDEFDYTHNEDLNGKSPPSSSQSWTANTFPRGTAITWNGGVKLCQDCWSGWEIAGSDSAVANNFSYKFNFTSFDTGNDVAMICSHIDIGDLGYSDGNSDSGICVQFVTGSTLAFFGDGKSYNSTSVTITQGVNYTGIFQFNWSGDSHINFKFWASPDAEPGVWDFTHHFTAADTLLKFGRYFQIGGTGVNDFTIDNLHNLSEGAAAVGGDAINISTPEPTNLTQFSFNNISINATVNSTFDINATLFIGKNGDTPTSNITFNNTAGGQNIPINFTINLSSGNYTYFINVTSGTEFEQTSEQVFYIDTVVPTSYFNILINTFGTGLLSRSITVKVT